MEPIEVDQSWIKTQSEYSMVTDSMHVRAFISVQVTNFCDVNGDVKLCEEVLRQRLIEALSKPENTWR